VEKLFHEQTLSLRAGRLSIGWEYGLDYANFTQILSAGFRLNLFGLDVNTPNFSVIPFSNWGARLRWTPNEKWRVQGSLMNDYPLNFVAGDDHGLDLSFAPAKGAFYILEGTRQWAASDESRRARPGLLPGRLFVGGFHDTGAFPALDGSGVDTRGMSTVYTIVKQKIWEPETYSERGANVWSGFSYAWPAKTALFPHFWSGGLVWLGPAASRPHDSLALGFANGWYSSSIPGTSTETVLEAAYSYVWTTWISIMPDIQYVIRPGGTGNVDNAFLLGALVYVTF
jgi:porin